MVKKAALLLSGLSYELNYKHWNGNNYIIDFKKYVANIKKNIINYFHDYNFDIYLSTNDNAKDDLIQIYHPISKYYDNKHNRIYKTIKGLELIMNNIKNNKVNYKFIVITRFDIYFLKTFLNIDLNKLNIVSILENNNVCDDNFHLFPTKYLDKFYNLLLTEAINKNYNNMTLHFLKHKFEENFEVNYLHNEYVEVNKLSFFKLRYFISNEFIINKYIFSNDTWYCSIKFNSKMFISNNIIYLNKIINKPRSWCWIGYEIKEKGLYKLSFEIYSNKNITNYDFIKLHKPVKFYSVKNINANQWTQIELTIETTEDLDLLCLIFDDFYDIINIQFKNLIIT